MENLIAAIPEDVLEKHTGTQYFDGYKVHVCNLNEVGVFNNSVITDDSYNATLIIGQSIDDVLMLEDEIDWCIEEEDWATFTDQGYGLDKRFNKVSSGIVKAFDLTQKPSYSLLVDLQVSWQELILDGVYIQTGVSLLTAESGDGKVCYHYRSYYSHWRKYVLWDDENLIVHESIESEEVTIDLDKKLDGGKYSVVRPVLKTAQIGTAFATYGYGACVAFLDGDTVRGTVYAVQGATLVYGVVKGETVLAWIGGEGKYKLTHGKAATIVVGAIEIAYCTWKYYSVDDEIMKLHYLEKTSAVVLDFVIFLSPVALWATLVLGVFIVLSYVVPDPVAREVCSSPGSLISFWIEYAFWGDETIPSVFCNVAYNEAQNIIIDECVNRNECGIPTRVILPGE